jgi:hypothetical protein
MVKACKISVRFQNSDTANGGNEIFALYKFFLDLPDQTLLGLAQKVNIELKKLMYFNLFVYY